MLTKKDYESSNEVRWCPGCGDHAILTTIKKTFADLQLEKEKQVIVSGIGCSSRLPYYVAVNGFHTIHGRAFPIATGLKKTRKDLTVWLITGDGDGLSIGLSHLYHMLRKDIDVKVIMFNNRIYGLTKGQYSPSSQIGQISKTSPSGVDDIPVEPISFALNAGATFAARSIDVDAKHLSEVLKQAYEHKGSAFVEVLQNCNVYNDGVYANFAAKQNRAENTISLQNNQPLVYGANSDKFLKFNFDTFKIESTENPSESIVHDVTSKKALAVEMAKMHSPSLPVALGVFYNKPNNIATNKTSGSNSFEDILFSVDTWEIS